MVVNEDAPPLTPQAFHILVTLAGGDQHGYAIMQEVAARTGGRVRLQPGTIYGTIKRLLDQGWIAEPRVNERPAGGDARRRCYRLTERGRAVAKAEAARLQQSLSHARQYGLVAKAT
ncbi:MAG TPA: PadR family transcriptional regulator [Terriglobales bacterium]|nr:PadR family transcriptional regulator [Terriglobales bacterium]